MSRWKQGIELAKISWGTIRGERSLTVFPVLGGVSALFLVAAFMIPAALLIYAGDLTWLGVVLIVIGAYAAAFAGTFFSVALASCADRALRGEDTTVGEGVSAARERLPQIAQWAAVLTTVNLIIRAIESRFEGIGGVIVAGLAGLAWGLVTFLAVPIIAFEGLGPWSTLKRSSGLFRERWGAQVSGQVVAGGVVAIIGILPAIALIVIGVLLLGGSAMGLGIALIAVGVPLLIVASIIGSALTQVLAVALYRFAADGVAVGPFTAEALQGVVRPRRIRAGRGTQNA